MNKIKNIFDMIKKYQAVIAYLFFGVMTTIINIMVYTFCYTYLNWTNMLSNLIAWILAVLVAYITNKIWVFRSVEKKLDILLYELFTFFLCRIATGVVDIVFMYITVDIIRFNALVMKFNSNVIVVILNFIASKFLVFKKLK